MTEPLTHIDWGFDNKVAVEYERTGECNGCGACCLALVSWGQGSISHGQNGSSNTDAEGLWTEVSRGNVRRFFKFKPVDTSVYSKCSMLNYDNKCRLHAYHAKKIIHFGWLFSPVNVTPFPTCSYSFREVRRWAFEP